MRVLAFDLGLNVGYACLERGKRPQAGTHRLPGTAEELGKILIAFEKFAALKFEVFRPLAVGYAKPFVGKFANPTSIGPLFALVGKLDEMAVRRGIPCYTVAEGDARLAFLGAVPRRSAQIKRAVIDACSQRNWPASTDHAADALVVADFILACLEEDLAHEGDPLFQAAEQAEQTA